MWEAHTPVPSHPHPHPQGVPIHLLPLSHPPVPCPCCAAPCHAALQQLVQEAGYGGIELIDIQDSWVRGVRMVNADNGVLISGCDRLTVEGLELAQTKPREGKEKGWHGHWGVRLGERCSAGHP